MDRRNFLKSLSLAGCISLMYSPLKVLADDANLNPVQFAVPNTGAAGSVGNVVIVGGGMAGATMAKYLRLWGGTGVKVTLIEKDAYYVSNIMSNTVLTGQRAIENLYYNWDIIKSYGVDVIQGEVTSIDSEGKTVTLNGSSTVNYGRLVLAPGLEFDLMPGMTDLNQYDTQIPHAWRAGPQTVLLRTQLASIPNGGTVVITIPKAPYRCPPGPYERTCVIADWLNTNRTGCKLIVLDANADIIVEHDNFTNAFNSYAGIVDYRPSSTVTNVSVTNDDIAVEGRSITYTDGVLDYTITANVLNPIPQQRAPKLLYDAGLCESAKYLDSSQRFAPINVLSYESTLKPSIHVIGDASFTTMPKAGHIGNQEAKTCADAILKLFRGNPVDQAPVTNSACYTPITSTTATWLSAVYQYNPATQKMAIPTQHNNAQAIAATGPTADNYNEMLDWFAILMGDTFA